MKTAYILLAILIGVSSIMAIGSKEDTYQTVTMAGVTFNYRVTPDLNNLDCQLSGATTGWIAVGFVPAQAMQSANFIIGYDTNGTTHIRDDWGTGQNTHASDTSLGGSNDILSSSSSEAAGITQLNFTIPLNSGDSFDRALAIGQTYNIILGRGRTGTDNFTGAHAEVGSAQITIVQPVSNRDDFVTNPAFTASAYPNPFKSDTSIAFQLKARTAVAANIYNTKGQLVKSIPASVYQKGENRIVWNATNNQGRSLPNGTYLCRITTPGTSHSFKLILRR